MSLLQGVKDVNHRIFGGYAELLRIPHAARFTVGSVIACMPFPMVGMTMTIMTQQYYGNYSLAGALTAVQAIAGAVVGPLLGTLVDRFGQRQVSIPTIVIWMLAAVSFVTCVRAQVTPWILFCIVPFFAAVPPWGAMSRARWTYLMGNDRAGVNRATFYIHYHDIADLLNQTHCEILSDLFAVLEAHREEENAERPLAILCDVFRFLQKHSAICAALLGERGDPAFVEQIKAPVREKCIRDWKHLRADDPDDSRAAYFSSYVVSGCVGLFEQWLKNGMKETPEDMAQLADRIIRIEDGKIVQ